MSNPIPEKVKDGTIGELIVQMRLLMYDVQAAPPIIDSGNDLIAVKETIFKTIQVKTTTKRKIQIGKLPGYWDILALVYLDKHNGNYSVERSQIYLLDRNGTIQKSYSINSPKLRDKRIDVAQINRLFR